MKIGLSVDGFTKFTETLAFAREAAQVDCTSVWMADHLGYREPMVSCLSFLMADLRVTVVLTAVSPICDTRLPTAMQMATLAEAGGGRVALGLGRRQSSVPGRKRGGMD